MKLGRFSQAALGHGAVQVLRVVSGLAVVPIQLRLLGDSGFAALTLLLSMPAWLAGLDLGLSGYLRTLVAGGSSMEDSVAATKGALATSARWAVLVALLGLPLAIGGVWLALGEARPEGVVIATAVYWLVFCASLPLTVGFAAFEAFGRTTSAAWMNGLAPGLVLAGTVAADQLGWGLIGIAAVSAVAMVAPRIVATEWLRRHMRGVVAAVPPTRQVLRGAAPFLAPAALWGLAFGLDPIILSVFGSVEDVASFGVIARLYALVIAVPAALVTTMWVGYATVRGSFGHDVWWAHGWRSIKAAAAFGAVCGIGFAVVTPFFVDVWLEESPTQVVGLSLAFGALIAAQVGSQPVTALLTRPDEMRQQSVTLVAMCVVNIVLSIVLVPVLGAPGPVLASAICLLAIHRAPAIVRFLRMRDASVSESTSG